MRHPLWLFGGATAALSLAFAMQARAQEAERPYLNQHVRAPANAAELSIGTGYTQGFGKVDPGTNVINVASAGVGVDVGVGYRIDPRWSIGIQGQYQEFAVEQDSAARGFAGNIGATYHLDPMMRGDPFVRLGTGYRMLWQVNPPGAPTMLRHGFELANAQIGVDIRVSEDVALAPIIGADLNMFLWERAEGGSNVALPTAQLNTFLYGGLQGRFDIGGTRSGTMREVADR